MSPRPPRPLPLLLRIALPVVLLLGLGYGIAQLDLRPGLRHLRTAMLSGPPTGHYHAIVAGLADRVSRGGELREVTTQGSADNLARLQQHPCETRFALAQVGTPLHGAGLELVARLPKAESVFLLGRHADALTEFHQLQGLRIGIGPEGSGTAVVARQVLDTPDFRKLGMVLTNHPLDEELALAARGDLDLALVVIDEDAALITAAVRDRGLQIAGLPHVDVIARQHPLLHHGRIGAGQYDPVRMLPPVDKEVLRVGTAVVASTCANRSQTLGLLTSLAEHFPDLVRHNRDTPNATGLELTAASRSYLQHGELELLDTYFPRLGDVMPPGNWVHVVMAVSVLFNLMGLANRFVLWRIDAARVKAEQDIARSFGPTATLGDIARCEPLDVQLQPALGGELDRVIAELERLATRSRRASLSVLVPMGGELAYRYQEQVMHETLAVLRAFRDRRERALASRAT